MIGVNNAIHRGVAQPTGFLEKLVGPELAGKMRGMGNGNPFDPTYGIALNHQGTMAITSVFGDAPIPFAPSPAINALAQQRPRQNEVKDTLVMMLLLKIIQNQNQLSNQLSQISSSTQSDNQ